MKTTGPVIAIGAITMGNQVLLQEKPVDWRIPIATAIAAGFFALAERISEKGAVTFAYGALVTVLFVRLDPKTPAPVESLNRWMQRKGG
jgi:hypothetical protein